MLMTQEFIKGCLPIPEKVRFHDVWIAANACLQDGVAYTFDIITRYRQHGGNVTRSLKVEQTGQMTRKLANALKGLIGLYRIPTDKFDLCDELKMRYGLKNPDFRNIYSFMWHLEHQSVKPLILKMLWNSFPFISTDRTRVRLPFFCAVWFMWERRRI